MRILIVKPSSIGDVVHALPTVNLVRKQFPKATISWLVNDTLASLLQECPVIDELIPFRRRHFGTWTGLADFGRFLAALRGRDFDLVLDLQGLFRSGLISGASRAPRRIGLSDAREGAGLFYNEVVPVPRAHAVKRYLCAARHLGCDTDLVEFPLGRSESSRQRVNQLLAPLTGAAALIGIHPSARWETKLWGDDQFAALIQELPPSRVFLTGADGDGPRLDKILSKVRHRFPMPLNLAGKADLFDLAELYRRCAVVVTNDSGPMHIAAAVGTPVVALFGPTDPELTGPWGKRHIVLRAGISCSPCLKATCTHTPRMECMTLVTPAQVLDAIKTFLG